MPYEPKPHCSVGWRWRRGNYVPEAHYNYTKRIHNPRLDISFILFCTFAALTRKNFTAPSKSLSRYEQQTRMV